MPFDPAELRRALARFATGVTIVGTEHLGGGMCGLTVNAFTSVSLDPPLVMVCVDRAANTLACLERSGRFAVSFLAAGQRELALRFAQRRDDKFEDVAFRLGEGGAPIVEGSIGHVECDVERMEDGGDHAILRGRITAIGGTGGSPLVFFGRVYTTVAGEPAG